MSQTRQDTDQRVKLFDAFCLDRRVNAAVSAATLAHYRYTLLPMLAAVPEMTAPAVYEYLGQIQQRFSAGGYRSCAIDIRAFLRWMHAEGHLATPIRLTVPKPADVLPATYDREAVLLILRAINRRTWLGARDYTIIHLLWDTGCRAGELCRLRRQDVLLAGSRVVRLAGKGRGGRSKERLKPISQTVAHLLRAWMRARKGSPTDFLFPSVRGARLNVNGLRQMIKRRCTAVGVRVDRMAHAWRHTFAVQAREHGADLDDLKEDLGHASYETVKVYLRASVGIRQIRHDRYSPVEGE